jgi:glucosamine-6-phosphate deaminase
MGIGTILEARHLMLLAYGTAKAEAVVKAIEGPLTSSVSASALQMHRNVTVLLDEGAAANLLIAIITGASVEQTAKYSPDRLGLK